MGVCVFFFSFSFSCFLFHLFFRFALFLFCFFVFSLSLCLFSLCLFVSLSLCLFVSLSLQFQICRRHSTHLRLTEAHNHCAGRLYHSYNGTRLKTQSISSTTSKRGRGNTVAVQGMNPAILPPKGKIKYLSQLITYKNAV